VFSVLLAIACAGVACAGPGSLSFGDLMMRRALVSDAGLGIAVDDSSAVPPDTATNKALDVMLRGFMSDESSTDLKYDSWTLTAHRFLGYAVLAGAAAQVVLGAVTYNEEKDGTVADTKDAHKYLGYTIVGLSVTQTALGYYNFYQMRHRETGRTKRWVHLTLSTLATAGFITAAAIAYNAREEIDSGQAGAEGKTFSDLYDTHRTVGILSAASVFLTAIVIVW
jgi:hypothetical protein